MQSNKNKDLFHVLRISRDVFGKCVSLLILTKQRNVEDFFVIFFRKNSIENGTI